MPPTKLYKFAAASVMTTVAAATVVTFSTADDADSSPVAAVLPQVPGSHAGAPSVGVGQTPEAILTSDDVTRSQAPPPPTPSPEPSKTASRSSQRDHPTTSPSSSTPKSRKPSPSSSPTPEEDDDDPGGLLGGLFGN